MCGPDCPECKRVHRNSTIKGICCYLAAIIAIVLVGIFGCSTPAPYSPNIDEAFVQAVAMQWEFGDVNAVSAIGEIPEKNATPENGTPKKPEKNSDDELTSIGSAIASKLPKSSAAAEGETTHAVDKGSAPPAVETSPKIVVYSTFGCRACVYLCKQLTEAGYDFDQVYLGGIEHRQTKFPYARIDGKRKTYEQVLAWLKERKESDED